MTTVSREQKSSSGIFITTAAAATALLGISYLFYVHSTTDRSSTSDNGGSYGKLLASSWAKLKRRTRRSKNGDVGNDDTTVADLSLLKQLNAPEDLIESFQAAVKAVRTDLASSNDDFFELEDSEKLLLYGLYKQATTVRSDNSNLNITLSLIARAKKQAWDRCKDLSPAKAAAHYVIAVEKLVAEKKECEVDNMNDIDLDDNSDDNNNDKNKNTANKSDSIAEADDMTSFYANTAPAVSRPRIDNGGLDFDGDDESNAGVDDMYNPSNHNDNSDNGVDSVSLELQLQKAIGDGQSELVRDILTNQLNKDGSKVDACYSDPESGQTILHLAVDRQIPIDIVEQLVLMSSPNDINAVDADGISVLQTAVIADNYEACKLLLERGADPDLADQDGDTPRSCALEDGSDALKDLFS